MKAKSKVRRISGDAKAVGRAVTRALRRPSTYPGALKEMFSTGLNIALFPAGLIGEAVGAEPTNGALRGRFSPQLALRYLDPNAASTPIILVHGYFHNRSAFVMMRRALRRAGYHNVECFNYNVIGHTVDELAQNLKSYIDNILECTGAEKVHLVGHSLGGLIARTYVQQYGGDETVHTCVTLGTPHAGTYAAFVGRGKAAKELRPASELIKRLDATARPSAVRWVSYYSNLDALIVPATSAKLTHPAFNATNILIKDLGHMSLLISSPLMHSIAVSLSQIATPEQPEPATVSALKPAKPARARKRKADTA
ncbi:MAG: esterase/lipase family protein [Actinomycetota bacterium]|nr:alpha/beta fold hydrolase [Actinomycetota bacterium]